ncbi:TldD/PmbA family protein [Colwellia sp. 4_MG-2023]|uniref:TldD/PmbA family protein n=1 Tax=unclassified Colwellia TaxID=196834 RepID=UPI001C099AAE|nr:MULTISPECIES: TldD/PmbA family protein [unclassified Colwellia]MBU2924700.1 TldD/PmbA family protein [Colwellia sp. C2M11]MDO6488408.1 TldD/PmbA family protein [Colwellia sp. 6_MG-2023]MDO6507049.1 TldD/PmbA family protein [Colwellia sp. 5_MG-2023]MDO6555905.1 TldD/PmbA family protein [Colwellia sp. 4_MG-2023]MDO6653536.1 TldD/PmbA family protein [Colwellia sp. 3_MG-2023]
MQRRDFIKLTGVGVGGLVLPMSGMAVSAEQLLDKPMDVVFKKKLADIALNAAKAKGATYADVRIGRYLNQFITTQEKRVDNIVNTESAGIGVRVIANGTWGFASTSNMTPDSVAKAAEQAVAVAVANSKFQTVPVQLAPVKGVGDVTWNTPITKNAFEVPIKDKVDLLLSVNDAAMTNGANYITSVLFLVNEQKYFASTDGSYIDQDVHRLWAPFFATAIGESGFKQRTGLGNPVGMGFEYLDGKEEDKIRISGANVGYKNSYDILEDAAEAGKQLKVKLKAKSVEPGKYDLVLDPAHLMLTIHESVGHPLELDRVLGYEANFAGTSFATLDKWKSGKFNYGSKIVNLVADKTQPYSLGNVGFDDEGVKTKEWDLVKDGTLVNYQATRDQVHMIDQKESHGCCYAQSWRDVQFQRMPNVSLKPNKEDISAEDVIKDVENGIYIAGRGSFSIDQQRYNFQFGGQLFYEIKNGKITEQIEDVAYQSNTQEFWNSCTQMAGKSDYRIGGSFFDGKGQPSQVSAVSHGCPTTRFNNINVINTARNV